MTPRMENGFDSDIRLILGGSRSGKSRRAEDWARQSGHPVSYVATCATAGMDAEMSERIRAHRQRRPEGWVTVEDRFDLDPLFREHANRMVLIDCLTLWLAYRHSGGESPDRILEELRTALTGARDRGQRMVIVSNEIGMGPVPESADARAFRDLSGQANQSVAEIATHVEWVIAGLPWTVKGGAGP